jgi:hypothetical protein
MKRYTISEMKAIQKEKNLHWFSESSMNFFNTVIETQPNIVNIFITSDRMNHLSPKGYSLRWFNHETGNVETLGEFQLYETMDQARAARRKYTLAKQEAEMVRP